MSENANLVTEQLKQLCRVYGLTQSELSKRLDVHPSQLSHYFNGHGDIRAELFISLLNQLGININTLLQSEITKHKDPQNKNQRLKSSDNSHLDELAIMLRGLPSLELRNARLVIEKLNRLNK